MASHHGSMSDTCPGVLVRARWMGRQRLVLTGCWTHPALFGMRLRISGEMEAVSLEEHSDERAMKIQ